MYAFKQHHSLVLMIEFFVVFYVSVRELKYVCSQSSFLQLYSHVIPISQECV